MQVGAQNTRGLQRTITYARRIVALLLGAYLGSVPSLAQNATWVGGFSSAPTDWNTQSNWNPSAVPTSTANFTNLAASTNISNSTNVDIGGINFTNNALAYTFTVNNFAFNINGPGITNSSTNTQTFVNNFLITLNNSASAGNTTIINNGEGFDFNNSATAGNAVIVNNGLMSFNNSATAGNATITNNGPLLFIDSATAGGATIMNNSEIAFSNLATAGNAIIITNNGGVVDYTSTASSGQAQFITNLGGFFDMSAAASAVTLGSIAGAGTYILGSNTLIVGSNNLSTTVSGVITDASFGGGSLVKVGSGTLTLDGANMYTGGTTISGGTLIVGDASNPGASIAGSATVNPGGTLGGYGSILGSVTNNGIVKPGGSIGLLTINGNYTQGPGGTLTIEISPTAASQLKVGGAANLGGSLALLFDTGVYTANSSYKIITAASVSGQFATILGTSPFVQTLLYDPADVTLFAAGSLPSYLQLVCLGNPGAIADSCNVTPTQTALTAIERSLATSTIGEIRSQTNAVIDQITARMRWVIRDLATLEDIPDAMPGDTIILDNFSSNEPLPSKYRGLSAGSPDSRWGVWASGSGSFLGNNTSTGYSGSSEVGLAGLDLLASRQWLLGFVAGYTHADLTLTPTAVSRPSRQVDGGLVGPYASYIINPHMAVDALFNYTSLGNSISAPTPLPNGGYHSNRVTGAAHFNVFTNYNALKLTGFGGYAYTWEGGPTSSVIGPGFGLANNVRYGAIRLGGEVSYHLGNFEPYLPLTFEYETTKPNDGTSRAAVVVGGGLRYRWNDTLAGELLCETTEIRTHSRDVLISAHLRQSF